MIIRKVEIIGRRIIKGLIVLIISIPIAIVSPIWIVAYCLYAIGVIWEDA